MFQKKGGENPPFFLKRRKIAVWVLEIFAVSQRVSPLGRRPKGFPVALWKPSGPTLLKRMGIAKNGSLAEGKGKRPFLLFPYHREFRLCGGDQGAFRSPPGPPIPPSNGRGIPPDPPCGERGTSPCFLTDRGRIGHAIWFGLGPATNRVPGRARTLHGSGAEARTAARWPCRDGPLPSLQG